MDLQPSAEGLSKLSAPTSAKAAARVKKQIHEMLELTEPDDEWEELGVQVMLAGHDGAHPHLPEVDATRAEVLLSLLRDLTCEFYTRPGKVKQAAQLRLKAVAEKRSATPHDGEPEPDAN